MKKIFDGKYVVILDEEFATNEGYEKIISDKRIAYGYNGKLHREDGPALIYQNGKKGWYIHDKRHREDGPAWIDGEYEQYWLNNMPVVPETYHLFSPLQLAKLGLI